MSSPLFVRLLVVATMSLTGCARASSTSATPLDGTEQAGTQHQTETQSSGVRQDEARQPTGMQAQHSAAPRRLVPNLPSAGIPKGFEPVEAEIMWSCNAQYFRLQSGSLVRSPEDFEAGINRAYVRSNIEDYCRTMLPDIDFDAYVLVVVELEFQAHLTYAAAREDQLVLGVSRSVYCGGPAPPGPQKVFVAIPAILTAAKVNMGPVVGECTGTPMP